MKKLALVLIVLLSVVPVAQANERDAAFLAATKSVIENYIRPSFDDFSKKAGALSYNLSGFCEAPTAAGIAGLERDFEALVLAYSRIEFLRFGPLVQDNRLEKLYFWPDRKSRALKRVQRELVAENADTTKVWKLKEKSVAVQGLGALEFLLYGTGREILSDPKEPFRCAFADAVANNIAQNATELAAEWNDADGYSKTWLNPSKDNPAYRSTEEVALRTFANLKDGIELFMALKLAPSLATEKRKARPKRTAFWRSGLTFKALAANLQALEDYKNASNLAKLLPKESDWIDGSISFEIGAMKNVLSSLPDDVVATFEGEDAGKLIYVQSALTSLQSTIVEDMGGTLGLKASFSSLDGD